MGRSTISADIDIFHLPRTTKSGNAPAAAAGARRRGARHTISAAGGHGVSAALAAAVAQSRRWQRRQRQCFSSGGGAAAAARAASKHSINAASACYSHPLTGKLMMLATTCQTSTWCCLCCQLGPSLYHNVDHRRPIPDAFPKVAPTGPADSARSQRRQPGTAAWWDSSGSRGLQPVVHGRRQWRRRRAAAAAARHRAAVFGRGPPGVAPPRARHVAPAF